MDYTLNKAVTALAEAATKALKRQPREVTASQVAAIVQALGGNTTERAHQLTMAIVGNPAVAVVPDPPERTDYR